VRKRKSRVEVPYVADRRLDTVQCSSEITMTSSSTVAERPRDALCPSVVCFNSVIHRAQSFIVVIWASDLPLCTIKCCSVVFGVTLRPWYISSSFPAINKLSSLPAASVIVAMVCRSWEYCTWRTNCSQHAMGPDSGSESRFLPILSAFDAPVRGREVPVGILPWRLVWKN